MRRILPFVLAIIVVIGGGLSFMVLRMQKAKVTQEENQTQTTQQESTTGPISPTVGTTAMKTSNPAKNQITLTITSPKDGTTVNNPSVVVKGKTLPNVDVSVNDVDTKSDASGNYSAAITLEEGDNYVVVVAVDESGQVAEQEMSVTYEVSQ